MAKKKSRGRRSRKTTLPITIVGPLAASGIRLVNDSKALGVETAFSNMVGFYTGYNPKKMNWQGWSRISQGIGPVVIGAAIHRVANSLGVNRALSGAGIPFIRI